MQASPQRHTRWVETFLRHETEAFLCDRIRRRRTGDECTGFPYDFAERLEQCQRDAWQVAGQPLIVFVWLWSEHVWNAENSVTLSHTSYYGVIWSLCRWIDLALSFLGAAWFDGDPWTSPLADIDWSFVGCVCQTGSCFCFIVGLLSSGSIPFGWGLFCIIWLKETKCGKTRIEPQLYCTKDGELLRCCSSQCRAHTSAGRSTGSLGSWAWLRLWWTGTPMWNCAQWTIKERKHAWQHGALIKYC